jgi:sigma-E factor negative regulatory protein RseB
MFHRLLCRAALGTAAFLLTCGAFAQDVGTQLSAPDAQAWLARIHDAASQRNYQGTLVFSAGGAAVSSSRIAHYWEGAQSFERIEALDGQARSVFRHNKVVYTVWPDQRLAVIEQRDPLTPFPSLLHGSEERLADHYAMLAQGTDRVAGHEAQVFVLRPRDAYRFGQRLWAEKNSGLLLRADILGLNQEVLESASFSEVAIGVRPQPETVLGPMKRLEGYRVVRPSHARTALEQEGWSIASPIAGFRQINCVKRPLGSSAAGDGTSIDVLQAVFSDGLTHVSLFIEPYNAERHRRAMHTSIGATHTLMRKRDDWWITVVGDVPVSTLKLFAQSLERRP